MIENFFQGGTMKEIPDTVLIILAPISTNPLYLFVFIFVSISEER